MIHVSSAWVEEGNDAHQLIVSIPEFAALLPRLTEAHLGLYALIAPPDDGPERELKKRGSVLNVEYDTLVRVGYGILTLVAQIEPDGEVLLGIRDLVFPEGLRHTQESYRAQAGNAKRVEVQLTAEQHTRLEAVGVGSTHADALVQRWIDTGNQLGEVQRERARLREPDPEGPTNLNEVRFPWIRVVNAFITLAELVGLSEEDEHLLFNELRIVEKRADARRKGTPDPTGEADVADEATSEEPAPEVAEPGVS